MPRFYEWNYPALRLQKGVFSIFGIWQNKSHQQTIISDASYSIVVCSSLLGMTLRTPTNGRLDSFGENRCIHSRTVIYPRWSRQHYYSLCGNHVLAYWCAGKGSDTHDECNVSQGWQWTNYHWVTRTDVPEQYFQTGTQQALFWTDRYQNVSSSFWFMERFLFQYEQGCDEIQYMRKDSLLLALLQIAS